MRSVWYVIVCERPRRIAGIEQQHAEDPRGGGCPGPHHVDTIEEGVS